MAGEIEKPYRFNFQSDLLHSGSISFGRFESESLSWERRSIFSHNPHLEDVEKYSRPGSVTEMKAYFEAEFRRKALLKQNSSGSQDDKEFQTVENDNQQEPNNSPPHRLEETEIQDNFDTSLNDEPMIKNVDHQLEETDQIRTENVVLVKREENITSQTADKKDDIASSGNQRTSSSNVRPASGVKQPKSKLPARTSIEASNGSFKPKIREYKGLIMKEKEKKSTRLASPTPHSVRKTSKSQESSMSILKAKTLPLNKSVVKECVLDKTIKTTTSARQTINRTKHTVITPSKPHISQSAAGFNFKSDQRAERRKEEKKAAEMTKSEKSLNFKATPMPSFYKESCRYSDQNKVIITANKTPNRPRTATMSPHTNKHSSNPRPTSSTSSTNRNRLLEPSKRLPEKKNTHKQNEPKPPPRARTISVAT